MEQIVTEKSTHQDELVLLRRRLARAKDARVQAEALLEEKSLVLAQANENLRIHKQVLSSELTQRTRQLLDAQRVAGFGTMIWDIDSSRGELSPHCKDMLGFSGSLEFHSIRIIMRQIDQQDRHLAFSWARKVTDGLLPRKDASGGAQSAQIEPQELSINLRIAEVSGQKTRRMIRVMALLEHDAYLDHSLVFLTLQDITGEIEATNESKLLRNRDQQRLVELEELADELRLARKKAEEANSAKTRFLAMMSHDIRTPMNGVIGMLQLFEQANLSDTQKEVLSHIKASGEQLRVLLDDIIDLEQAESGNLMLNIAPINMSILLETAIGFWNNAAQEKRLSLTLSPDVLGKPLPELIRSDRQRLRQIIDNLLSNAIKYTHRGHITVHAGQMRAGHLRMEFVDTGIGIPPESRRELFDNYGQMPLSEKRPGSSGLGLAICSRIILLMGGDIGVADGNNGVGTRFWVEIPFTPAAEGSENMDKSSPSPIQMPNGSRPHILVAEDVETNRLVVQGLLHKLGCDVTLTEDGQQAIDAITKSEFDLVLMDMSMPGIDGTEATRRIRAMSGSVSRTPIIALTAYSRPEELAPIFAAGADSSITKPLVLNDLYKVVAAALETE